MRSPDLFRCPVSPFVSLPRPSSLSYPFISLGLPSCHLPSSFFLFLPLPSSPFLPLLSSPSPIPPRPPIGQLPEFANRGLSLGSFRNSPIANRSPYLRPSLRR
ncbi:unnamed protein product [Closterium sp. Naga37s-1]|nr:unnamed protein product [Closterium sp. Naga37s-1]